MNINLKWLKDTIEEMRGIYHFADEDASIVINGGFPYPDSYMVIVRTTDKETGIDISLEKWLPLSDGERVPGEKR